jgi:hypothetical protein
MFLIAISSLKQLGYEQCAGSIIGRRGLRVASVAALNFRVEISCHRFCMEEPINSLRLNGTVMEIKTTQLDDHILIFLVIADAPDSAMWGLFADKMLQIHRTTPEHLNSLGTGWA